MRIAVTCVIVGLVHYACTLWVGLEIFSACYGAEGAACDFALAAGKIVGFPMFTFVYPNSVEGRIWGIANSAVFALCAVGLTWAARPVSAAIRRLTRRCS